MLRLPDRARQVCRETCRPLTELEAAVERVAPQGCDNCGRRPERVATWHELGAVEGIDEVQVYLCLPCAKHFMGG